MVGSSWFDETGAALNTLHHAAWCSIILKLTNATIEMLFGVSIFLPSSLAVTKGV